MTTPSIPLIAILNDYSRTIDAIRTSLVQTPQGVVADNSLMGPLTDANETYAVLAERIAKKELTSAEADALEKAVGSMNALADKAKPPWLSSQLALVALVTDIAPAYKALAASARAAIAS